MPITQIQDYTISTLLALDLSGDLSKTTNFYNVSKQLTEVYKALPEATVGDPCLGRTLYYNANGDVVAQRAFKTIWTQGMEDLSTVPITDIDLDGLTIDEDLPIGTIVGNIVATGGIGPVIFSIDGGSAEFEIVFNNQLQSKISVPSGSYPLTIKAVDAINQEYSEVFNIVVADYTNEKSIAFDGVNDHIDCGVAASIQFERTDKFSASAWIKPDSVLVNQRIMGNVNSSPVQGWEMIIFNAGVLMIQVMNSNNGPENRVKIHSTNQLTDAVWQHVCFTYDGSSTAAGTKMYINGVLEPSVVDADNLSLDITASSGNFTIGMRNGVNLPFQGNIDEPSVWNKELSAAEVTEIYNSGTPADLQSHSASANLAGWWRCGDGDTFPTITDQQGANNGTMTNMDSGDIEEETP